MVYGYRKSEQRIEVLMFLSDGNWRKLGEIPFQIRNYSHTLERAKSFGRNYSIQEYYRDNNQAKSSLLFNLYKEGYVERKYANMKWYLYRITSLGREYLLSLQQKFMR